MLWLGDGILSILLCFLAAKAHIKRVKNRKKVLILVAKYGESFLPWQQKNALPTYETNSQNALHSLVYTACTSCFLQPSMQAEHGTGESEAPLLALLAPLSPRQSLGHASQALPRRDAMAEIFRSALLPSKDTKYFKRLIKFQYYILLKCVFFYQTKS